MPDTIRTDHGLYLFTKSGEDQIHTQGDLLGVLASCSEEGTRRLVLSAGSLDPDFFDLSSGLAGEFFLKLSTYRMKTAVVLGPDTRLSSRFGELMAECNRGKEIRFCRSLSEAESWLFR